ncbi:MAG TPA: hypothetical protein PK573_05250 [Spirochaetota bacterium]|nr:hypothetical protein [Spirochaetota bacterium]HRZ25601.1 hypothetical protein [Spirochaetota bacterium]HSA15323.1 hypothetical protein [Spirochaetota bacterium]
MKRFMIFLLLFQAVVFGCTTGKDTVKEETPQVPPDEFLLPEKYNVRFIGYDDWIDLPENDRRCYYRVFIDKADEGRTTTGLESQEKYFETNLEPNRHLIMVEKWVLDESEGKYYKLNNIDQPRPNFVYFDLPGDRVVIITMVTGKDLEATFSIDLARK